MRSLDFCGWAHGGSQRMRLRARVWPHRGSVRRSVSTIAEYLDARELAKALTLREIRGQYKGSVLGWFWSLLNPLTTVLVFSFLFAVLGSEPPIGDPSGLKFYALYFFTGLVPWNFFSSTVSGAAGSVVGQGALISKVYFPRAIVVVSKLGAVGFTSLMEMLVAVVLLLIAGNMVLPWLPLVALLLVLQSCFALGIGLMLSVANVYFRDIGHFVGILLQVLFYSAPIVYPIELVEQKLGAENLWIYRLNPLVDLIEAYHHVLYDLRMPSLGWLAYLAAWSVLSLVVGVTVFSRFEGRLAEEL